jgi:hypothetical protein
MINSTKQLNEIIRNLSNENANTSISQLAAIIDLCSKAGIRFSYDVNYEEALASFTANKFPEWNSEITNSEIESLANHGKYEEAAVRRDKTLVLKNEIHRQFRLEKYGTENWFTEKSESEILFSPTKNAVIDSLVPGYIL